MNPAYVSEPLSTVHRVNASIEESIAVYCEPCKQQNRVIPIYVFRGVSLVNATHFAIRSLYEVSNTIWFMLQRLHVQSHVWVWLKWVRGVGIPIL